MRQYCPGLEWSALLLLLMLQQSAGCGRTCLLTFTICTCTSEREVQAEKIRVVVTSVVEQKLEGCDVVELQIVWAQVAILGWANNICRC